MDSSPIYPCSCGGRNPQCYRCDGNGIVSSWHQGFDESKPEPRYKHRLAAAPAKRRKRRRNGACRAKPQHKPEFQCPACRNRYQDPQTLERHLASAHADKLLSPVCKHAHAATELWFPSRCLVCNHRVKSLKSLDSHLVTYHKDARWGQYRLLVARELRAIRQDLHRAAVALGFRSDN
jgi:hypothetical protein